MRLLALKKAGAKECVAKIVTGLTPEQKREFVIKDNGTAWGEWDFDLLSSSWSDLPLIDFGVDLPKDWLGQVEEIDPPELKDGDRAPFQQMTFTLHDEQVEELNAAIKKANNEGGSTSAVNENSNGNALYEIVGNGQSKRYNRQGYSGKDSQCLC